MPVVIESRVGEVVGYVVIDSFVNGSSAGGTRIAPDVSHEEVAALAAEMTFKFRFFNLQRGGAKCGIRIPSGTGPQELLRLLQGFGASIAPIIGKGLYYPGGDLGCGPAELAAIYRGAGLTIGPQTDSAFYTAMTVGAAVEACAEHRLGQSQMARVAIEGFGKVGAHLAERLDPTRYRIVAVSTEEGALVDETGFSVVDLITARTRHGNAFVRHLERGERLAREGVLAADAEILIPSARTWSIGPDTASRVRAQIIVPAANAPYADGALEVLAARGVLCLPGFVSNAGGVWGSTLKDRGMVMEKIEQAVRGLYLPMVRALVKRSDELGTTPVSLAEAYVTSAARGSGNGCGDEPGLLPAIRRRLAASAPLRKSRNRRYIGSVLEHLAALPDHFGSMTLVRSGGVDP